ncbi:MAG: HEAT repeat domain-containing protein, partial [Acidimicrobiales bacterium]|nr:HEAT repeat domain-containing protein [Acidimicrobiales bacterium]
GPETKIATRHLLFLHALRSRKPLLDVRYLREFTNRTVKQLIELLKDESAEVRERSARILGSLNPPVKCGAKTHLDRCDMTAQDLVNALRPLLKDKEIIVRVRAGGAIATLTPNEAHDVIPAIIEGIEEKVFGAYEAVDLLRRVTAEAIPLLIKGLDHENDSVQFELTNTLNYWPDLAMPHLVLAIKNDNARVRAGAAHAMGSYLYRQNLNLQANAIKSLVPALKDRDVEVRLRSAEGLLFLAAAQVKDTIPVFIACLSDDSPRRRERAASSLGRIGPTATPAIPELLKTLKDTRVNVRIEAAIAITKIEPHRVNAVLPVLKESILLDSQVFTTHQKRALKAVQTLGKSAALLGPALMSKLSEPPNLKDRSLQIEEAKTLAKVDEANAQIGVEKIIQGLLDREHTWMRIQVIQALGELGSIAKPALPPLLDLMNDESPAVATAAAVSSVKLDPMRSNKAWAFLRTSMTLTKPVKDLDRQQRTLIRESVKTLKGEDNKDIAAAFLPELIVLLEVPECHVRLSIVHLLGSLGPSATSAIPVLKRLVIEGSYISDDAEDAIKLITAEPTSKIESPEMSAEDQ